MGARGAALAQAKAPRLPPEAPPASGSGAPGEADASSPGSSPAGSGAAPGSSSAAELPPAPDFTLVDQNGETHTLSDYQGKVVFLNFWATWCGPCQREMPEIEQLYLDSGGNAEDLVVLGVANPKSADYPNAVDNKTAEEITKFLADGGYTYPVVMDVTGDLFRQYGISAYPTTFMIDAQGSVFGYIQGSLTRDIMDSIVEQTKSGVRAQ